MSRQASKVLSQTRSPARLETGDSIGDSVNDFTYAVVENVLDCFGDLRQYSGLFLHLISITGDGFGDLFDPGQDLNSTEIRLL